MLSITPRLSHIRETSVAEICFQLLRKRVSPKYGISFKIAEAKDDNVLNNFRLDYVMNLSWEKRYTYFNITYIESSLEIYRRLEKSYRRLEESYHRLEESYRRLEKPKKLHAMVNAYALISRWFLQQHDLYASLHALSEIALAYII